MVELIRDPLISIKPYLASLKINPSSVFYQRVSSRNVSNTNCEFTVSSPNRRSYLLAHSQIEWRITHENHRVSFAAGPPATQAVGIALDYGESRPLISLKPVLPMTNSFSSITCSINGSTTTVSQPRRYQSILNQLLVSKEEASTYFSSAYPEDMGGCWDLGNPGVSPGPGGNVDTPWYKNQMDYCQRLLKGVDATAPQKTSFAGNNNLPVQITENVACPPFNEYAMVKRNMPAWSPHAKMSDVIPNVDRLELQIQIQKLAPSIIEQQYGMNPTGGEKVTQVITAGAVQATLLLYWYEVPVSTEIPRSIDLNTWEIREFITPVGLQSGAFSANGVAIPGITSDLIQLNSVPSLIMISIQRDKNALEYQATSMTADIDNAGDTPAVAGAGPSFHSHDSCAEINSIQVILGSRPNVVSSSMSQEELFRLTSVNAKKLPYTFNDWRGQRKPVLTAGALDLAGDWQQYGSTGFVAFTPQQLAERTSTGVFAANSVQFVVNATPHDGFAGLLGGDQRWIMYIHVFYSAAFLRISNDASSFQQQSLDQNVARQLTDPPLAPSSLGGSISVGGGLPSLRNKALSNYQSRVG